MLSMLVAKFERQHQIWHDLSIITNVITLLSGILVIINAMYDLKRLLSQKVVMYTLIPEQ